MMKRQLSLFADRPASPLPEEWTDSQLVEQLVCGHNESAFAMLLRRYGPLVLGVCRRLLHHAHDVEDAFQNTFLVLVRKAASLKRPELLAAWLYGVAYRTARQARAQAARRSQRERAAVLAAARNASRPAPADEVRHLLDQELAQLPEKYRAPLVLCYLQGKTNVEAARLLGWPTGSMSARLARGRELLRERLLSRQLARSLALPASFIANRFESVTRSTALVRTTVQGALTFPALAEMIRAPAGASAGEPVAAVLEPLPPPWCWCLGMVLALLLLLALASTVYGALHKGQSISAGPMAGWTKH